MSIDPAPVEGSFDAFVRVEGARLRRVMVARYGVDVGCDAADSTLAWAWERWARIGAMDNPAGYLYRVARTHASRAIRRGRTVTFPGEPAQAMQPGSSLPDGDVAVALRQLSEPQRMAVLLVHAYGWTPTEVGELTGMPAVTVRSHLRRGLRQLRKSLPKGIVR